MSTQAVEEPVYEYRKGNGWIVVNPLFCITQVHNDRYRITIEFRKPEKGERGWCIDDLAPEEILPDLEVGGWCMDNNSGKYGFGWAGRYVNPGSKYVTVFTEKL